ncbi:MAG: ABC-2 family transporter protein, partial [Candidatus Thermochlorobacter sp.]
YVSFGSLLDLIFALGLLTISFFNLDVSPTALDVLAYTVLAISGLIVMYSIQVFFAALGFIFVNASTGLQWGFHHLYQLAMRPEAIYKGIMRFFLLYLLPMIVISSVPATMILRGFDAQTFLTCIAISVIALFATRQFFYFALSRYESASS